MNGILLCRTSHGSYCSSSSDSSKSTGVMCLYQSFDIHSSLGSAVLVVLNYIKLDPASRAQLTTFHLNVRSDTSPKTSPDLFFYNLFLNQYLFIVHVGLFLFDDIPGSHFNILQVFPPNIYYKIFTHRPIQDLCANSPKNYSQVRRKDPRQLHNKGQVSISNSTEDWYKRIENNGWRQISDRMLTKIFSDPITYESSFKPVTFEYDARRKIENKKAQRKKIKLKWLRKMYNLNLLDIKENTQTKSVQDSNEETDFNQTKVLVKKATESMIETLERKGDKYIEDWAVDELLSWTSSLSYESYLNDWNTLATSLVSDWKLDLLKSKQNNDTDRSLFYTDCINPSVVDFQ